jgi:hypothetical protein
MLGRESNGRLGSFLGGLSLAAELMELGGKTQSKS